MSTRILALGDSYTLGAGVRGDDAWPARLEALLNAGAPRNSVQVFNCAVAGAGTQVARERYHALAASIEPHLVLLGVVLGDDTAGTDDTTVPQMQVKPLEQVFRLLHRWHYRSVEQALFENSTRGIPTILSEVAHLDSIVRSAGSSFAVLLLQDQQSRSWNALAGAFEDESRINVPVLSLAEHLRIFGTDDRYVLPPLDTHPSRTVHRLIAEATATFVRRRGLLAPGDSVVR